MYGIFAWKLGTPKGGFNDLVALSNDLSDLYKEKRAFAKGGRDESEGHIVDLDTGEIIKTFVVRTVFNTVYETRQEIHWTTHKSGL